MIKNAGATRGWLFAVAITLAAYFSVILVVPAFADSGSTLLSGSSVQSSDSAKSVKRGTLTVSGLESFGGVSVMKYEGYNTGVYLTVSAKSGDTVTITSSKPSLVAISSSDSITSYGYEESVYCEVKGVGLAKVTVSDGKNSIVVPIVSYPFYTLQPKSVTKATYRTVRLKWTPIAGVSGYLVKRVKAYSGADAASSTIATVRGASVSTTTVPAAWGVEYAYTLVPYVAYGGSKFMSDYSYGGSTSYTLPAPSVTLKPVVRSGSKLKVSWSAEAGASRFRVYRSTKDNSGFKRIATTKAKAYVDKNVKKGVTYYYRVRATYPKCSAIDSGTFGQFVAKKTKVLRRAVKISQSYGAGAYSGWNWANPDEVSYYTQGSRLYAVRYTGSSLKVYGLNENLKKVSTKTVKLPSHDQWGGFFHGTDGNNYVAIGYNNLRESKTKTVIKVIKYSGSWKKGKTAAIKGSASNAFVGIYLPFQAGVASFDMNESTLYLFTCREMFKDEDGLHHQSNIAFSIDTKTMKATSNNFSYVSHSFNQRVKFKDGNIYLADHGDAYPRGICLNAAGYFDTSAPSWTATPFAFQGKTGANYTGATMAGMEVGSKHVLVCGTAQPHNYKIAGVRGFGSYKHNVYLIVTDRLTGKSSMKWLTNINPKKGKQTVGEARIVKLADNQFAVLYSVKKTAGGKEVLHCTMVNDSGKVLKSKTYANVKFTGSSQPVVYNGSICWVEKTSDKSSTAYAIPTT